MAKKQVDDFDLFCTQEIIKSKSTEELKRAGKFLKNLLKLRTNSKLFDTYIEGIRNAADFNEEDIIYADFRFDGTRTGRLSCAQYKAKKAKGVSFHTIPQDEDEEVKIRRIFIAPPGKAFITADYSGMELRVLSHIGQVKKMIEAFHRNADLHSEGAAFAFDLDPKAVTKSERNIGKTGNFLTVFGGGATNLSQMAGISLAKAKKFLRKYDELYPEVNRLRFKTWEEVENTGKVRTIFGRVRHLPNIKSRINWIKEQAKRQAFNTIISSPASDINLCCLVDAFRVFYAEGLDVDLVAAVHDSIELICNVEDIAVVSSILYSTLINYPMIKKVWGINFSVPLNVEMVIGRSFGSGVEAHFNQESKLINLGEIEAGL